MANDSEAALQASRAALNASLADTNTNGPAPVSEPNAPNSPPVIEQFERLAPPSANSADEGAQEREESLEPGEIAEVDMESQANGIRTVFSDPKNFNVKVCNVVSVICFSLPINSVRLSTRYIRRGHCGSTLRLPRAAICPKHRAPRCPQPLYHRRQEVHTAGWTI